jgi:hypothetical protein
MKPSQKKAYRKMVAKIKTDKIMVIDGNGNVQGRLEKNLKEWKKTWGDTIPWKDDFRVKKF